MNVTVLALAFWYVLLFNEMGNIYVINGHKVAYMLNASDGPNMLG